MAVVLTRHLRKRARWSLRRRDGVVESVPSLGGYPVGRITVSCCGGSVDASPSIAPRLAAALEERHKCAGF